MGIVITTFNDKRRKKQWYFEKRVLKEISMQTLRKDVNQHFLSLFYIEDCLEYTRDTAMDIAIEAFLLGANVSRLGYYGEPKERLQSSCRIEVSSIVDELFDVLCELEIERVGLTIEELYKMSDAFIDRWWNNGFEAGIKRYRLRLH